jgi:hypothetical protein
MVYAMLFPMLNASYIYVVCILGMGLRGGAVGRGRKFAGSIPDGFIWIFNLLKLSGRTMVLG